MFKVLISDFKENKLNNIIGDIFDKFEVENKVSNNRNNYASPQKTIEFNNTNVEKFELNEKDVDIEFSTREDGSEDTKYFSRPKTSKERNNSLDRNQLRHNNNSKSTNIDELEEVPAYKRKDIDLEDFKLSSEDSTEISRFTLSDDESGDNTNINYNNSYLFDNVD